MLLQPCRRAQCEGRDGWRRNLGKELFLEFRLYPEGSSSSDGVAGVWREGVIRAILSPWREGYGGEGQIGGDRLCEEETVPAHHLQGE